MRFVQKIAQFIKEKELDLGALTIIVPSDRAINKIKQELSNLYSIPILSAVVFPRPRSGGVFHGRSIVSCEPKLHVVDKAKRRGRVRSSDVIVVLFGDFSGKTVAVGGFDDIDQLVFRRRDVVDSCLFQHANRFGRIKRPRRRVRLRLTCARIIREKKNNNAKGIKRQ